MGVKLVSLLVEERDAYVVCVCVMVVHSGLELERHFRGLLPSLVLGEHKGMKQGLSWEEGSEERRRPLHQPLHPPNTQQDGRPVAETGASGEGEAPAHPPFTLPCPLSSPGG